MYITWVQVESVGLNTPGYFPAYYIQSSQSSNQFHPIFAFPLLHQTANLGRMYHVKRGHYQQHKSGIEDVTPEFVLEQCPTTSLVVLDVPEDGTDENQQTADV